MAGETAPMQIIAGCQRRLAPLRKYEDNVVQQLNRINTREPSACQSFYTHLQSLWAQRRAILDSATESLDKLHKDETTTKTVSPCHLLIKRHLFYL